MKVNQMLIGVNAGRKAQAWIMLGACANLRALIYT